MALTIYRSTQGIFSFCDNQSMATCEKTYCMNRTKAILMPQTQAPYTVSYPFKSSGIWIE